MTDTLNLNDGLLAGLRLKDETLVKREEYFAIVSRKRHERSSGGDECAEQFATAVGHFKGGKSSAAAERRYSDTGE